MNALRNIAALAVTVGLVAYFWSQGERFIEANGPTFDEGIHLTAGYAQWTRGDFGMNREDPPFLKLLWALPLVLGDAPPWPDDVAATSEKNPWHIADAFVYRSGVSHTHLFTQARRMNLALGCGVVLLVGWWAFRLWGSRLAGLAACGFAAFDPTLLALSCVLSTDLGLTLFGLLTTYLLWEYAANPRRELLFAVGVCLGLLIATKFSAIAIVLALGLTAVVFLIRGGTLALPGKSVAPDLRSRLGAAFELAFRIGIIGLVTLAATYGFLHFNEWGAGLKFQLTRSEFGDGEFYLNGERSRTGWYHYFLVVLPMKLPLATPLAASLALASGWRKFSVWLVIPPLTFFALASIARVDLGVRVMLPVLPFLYLFAARLAVPCSCCFVRVPVFVGCLAWSAVASWNAAPHQIAYFNELAGGSTGGLKYCADSNLDWGQGLPSLKSYMQREGIDVVYLSYFGTDRPEAYDIRYQALPGYGRVGVAGGERIPLDAPRHVVAVSANHLVGLMLNDPETFVWLRTRQPVAVLGGSIYVFDITDDADAIRRVR